ncbi:hypothetical protein P8C59_002919 [Phyllachora maydis]|uniref:Glycerol uptake protein 1 n=1 Tax=Phyllachora maydis TaxID=1825666 RepID=A0AAD9HZD4_9PEZI|nr:hypothetical protein P8C59_002919 [Phyllachora maydis]
MGLLSFIKAVYDLDTLDTRFTTPSTVPYKTVVESRKNGADKRETVNKTRDRAQPSKWNTPEFYLYYLVVGAAVYNMFRVAYNVSRPSDHRYAKYERFLSPGWIPGRKIDVSDDQYHSFRQNIPYMALLLVFHPLLRRVWNTTFPIPSGNDGAGGPEPEIANARLKQRTSYDFTFALLFLVVLHGLSAAKILAILYLNYVLAKRLCGRPMPVATWVCNVALLFANELCDGYKFRDLAEFVAGTPADGIGDAGFLIGVASWMDGYGGLMPRWHILFNITILRLISFNLDYYWSLDRRHAISLEKQIDPASLSERERISFPAAPGDYNFRNLVAYAIYAPLYLTGPILTFNDYISQSRYRPCSIETSRTVRYGVRFLLVLLCMEVVLHYDYVGAIGKATPQWGSYTAAQLSLLSYFNLHIIWLKLLLPWRLFRLWSLVDGVDPPENMVRCVSDNFSTLMFWRSWHRSYNRWLLRYIWIPLGGGDWRSWRTATRTLLTYLLVFTFVALWHDIQLRLLVWGWLIVVFMVPEVAARHLFPHSRWGARPTAYRMLCCAGAVGNVLMMMMANLVGFAVGLDGLQSILRGILHDWSGPLFLLTACGALFVGVQVMFEVRQSELRKGIDLKC